MLVPIEAAEYSTELQRSAQWDSEQAHSAHSNQAVASEDAWLSIDACPYHGSHHSLQQDDVVVQTECQADLAALVIDAA